MGDPESSVSAMQSPRNMTLEQALNLHFFHQLPSGPESEILESDWQIARAPDFPFGGTIPRRSRKNFAPGKP